MLLVCGLSISTAGGDEPQEPRYFQQPQHARPVWQASPSSNASRFTAQTRRGAIPLTTSAGRPTTPQASLPWRSPPPNRLRSRTTNKPRSRTIIRTSGVELQPAGQSQMRSVLGGPRVAQLPAEGTTGTIENPFGDSPTPQLPSPEPAANGINDAGAAGERSGFDPFKDQDPALAQPVTPPESSPSGLPLSDPPTPIVPDVEPNELRNSEFQPTPADPETTPYRPDLAPESADDAPPPPFSVAPETPAETPPQGLPDADNSLRRGDTGEKCKETYNGRDCCKEADKCSKARDLLEFTKIREITLDITPKFSPDLGDFRLSQNRAIASEVARERAFEDIESRPWKDRRGRVLTNGKLVNFDNGRVYIETDAGEVVRVPVKELSDDDTCYMTAWWQIPSECSLTAEDYQGRHWVASTMTWKASALCHKPLYFEEVQLERYGHSAGPITQPILSGAHFFLNIAVMPYKMGIHPPHECQYALGYYRPGSCAPWLVPPVPLSVRGALTQAAVVVGGIYILP